MGAGGNEARRTPGYARGANSPSPLLIFIVALLIYVVSPVVTSSDAMFAMHVAASFYKGLHGELSPWLPAIKAAPRFSLSWHAPISS